MPNGLFDVLTESEVLAILRRQAARQVDRNDEQWKLTERFLENGQLARTKTELVRRYPNRQSMTKGEQIAPFVLPLTDRYVAEAANAYNKPVARELVDAEGTVNNEQTANLQRLTAGVDEHLHNIERYTVAQDAQPAVVQAKRGLLHIQPAPLYQTHPVLPEDASQCDRSDQCDYMGHVLELDTVDKDIRKWVFATPAAHYYYESADWSEPSSITVQPNTGYVWPQRELTADDKESIAPHPLQTVVWWHRYIPQNKLLPVSDVPLVQLNLELNVQLSCMLDTLRKQGWSQLVAKVMDPTNPPASMPMGTGFMLALGLEESIESVSMANDYGGMVGFLKFLVQFFSVLQRGSPNDFSVEGTGPQSGFAKLVDSLPKMEARADRIRRLKDIEERLLWPRIGAVGKYLGVFPDGIEQLHMRTKFGAVEFPKTADERIKDEDQDIKLGHTTPAKLYAEKHGVSLDEAEQAIEENKQTAPAAPPAQQQPEQNERRTIRDIVAQRQSELNRA